MSDKLREQPGPHLYPPEEEIIATFEKYWSDFASGDLWHEMGPYETASYCWTYDGKMVETGHTMCHGGIAEGYGKPRGANWDKSYLSTFFSFKGTRYKDFLDFNHKFTGVPKSERERLEKLRDKVLTAYSTWLINSSPWKDVYLIRKNVGFTITKGQAMNIYVPDAVFIGACIAYRHMWEHTDWLAYVWYPLVEAGCDPHLAFTFGQQIQVNRQDDDLSWLVHCTFPGHMAVSNRYLREGHINFRNGVPQAKFRNKPTFHEAKGYSYVNDYWGPCTGLFGTDSRTVLDCEQRIYDRMKEVMKVKKADDKDPTAHLDIFLEWGRTSMQNGNNANASRYCPPIPEKFAPQLAEAINKEFIE